MKKIILLLLFIPLIASSQDRGFNVSQLSLAKGFLSIKNSGYCNATLISDDLAITNAHCLAGKKNCQNVFLEFFDDGGDVATESYKCVEIVVGNEGAFDPKETNPEFKYSFKVEEDFAILRFSGTPGFYRDYLKVYESESWYTPGNKDFSWILKYDPPTAIRDYVTESLSICNLHIGPSLFLVMTKNNDISDVCHFQQGNSGSSVVNSDGEIIGLIAQGKPGVGSIPSLNIWNMEYMMGPSIVNIDKYVRSYYAKSMESVSLFDLISK